MDVKINTQKLVEIRNHNAWSQQRLADIAGISLRTVQRIENKGVASKESLQALSAAFNLVPADLIQPSKRLSVGRRKLLVGGVLAFVAAGIGMGFTLADQSALTLAVKAAYNDQPYANVRFTGEMGVSSEYALEDRLRLSVLPTPASQGHVMLNTEIFERQDGQFYLLASPAMMAEYNVPAKFVITANNGSVYEVEITPERVE